MSTTDGENDIERGVYQTPSNDDDLYDDYDDEGGFARGPVFAIMAVMVLGAFVGMMWLAYQYGLSQANTPTIISASTEPFKIEPADPGGMEAPAQSLTNDAISGQPLEQVTEVRSSSETPIEVPQNNTASAEPPVQMAANETADTTPELRTNNNEIGASGGVMVPRPSDRIRNAEADADLRPNAPAGNSATGQPDTQPATQPSQPATRQPDPTPEVIDPEITRPQPTVQDASIGPQLTGPPATAANTGNFVVQVASFPEIPDANAAWSRLQSRHAGIVGGHVQDIQDVDLGERGTWYRLRIGYFETRTAATSLCDQLKAANQDCLVASR